MGGLGPGIGGAEYLVIAIVALLVVGPERLPLLLRKLGKMIAKARGMANEFRSSFDEMARQSELDDLRKEVEALRNGGTVHALGADADAAFKGIRDDLNRPIDTPMLDAPDEWPDSLPVMTPLEPTPVASKPRARKPAATGTKAAAKPKATKPAVTAKAAPRPRRKTAAKS